MFYLNFKMIAFIQKEICANSKYFTVCSAAYPMLLTYSPSALSLAVGIVKAPQFLVLGFVAFRITLNCGKCMKHAMSCLMWSIINWVGVFWVE